tara:strand:- start:1915 stop:2793 length:879 start_codon:yes stop_codon:yes gene_type:complete
MNNLELNSTIDLKREGKSFYWASFFLPKKSRENAGILYSICRYFDDIADKNNEDKTTYLEGTIKEIKNNKSNKVNIFLQKNNIHQSIFIDLIEGLITDQRNTKIQNKDELIKYSYHVAGTVGLMMSKIIGVKHDMGARSAIDLGIGMQLTNIARDVYEDAKIKRIYLPANWITNISLNDLGATHALSLEQDEKIANAIHEIINLSEQFYKNGFAGLKYIPLSTRLAIFIAANVYRGIGIKIKKNKKYIRKRVYLTLLDKTLITMNSILFFVFLPLFNFQYKKIRNSLPNENL